MGSTLSRCQADLLTTHFDQVLLMLDGDDAGRHGAAAITAALAGRIGVVPIVMDEGRQPDQLKPVAIQHFSKGTFVANAPVRVSREETRDFATVRAVYSGSGEFPEHVVQEDGLPNVALTVFANELRRMLSDGSVRGYIRETLAFVNWCASDPAAQTRHWHWQAEPPQVRHAVCQYLTVVAECRITVRRSCFGDHYWTPALRAAGLDADPHLAGHWFVTNALRHVEHGARDEAALARRKQELIQYMAWRSGEQTLRAYEHLERSDSFQRRLCAIHQTMRRRERLAARPTARPRAGSSDGEGSSPGRMSGDLAYLLGEDDDDS
jgi:hypothetical protein